MWVVRSVKGAIARQRRRSRGRNQRRARAIQLSDVIIVRDQPRVGKIDDEVLEYLRATGASAQLLRTVTRLKDEDVAVH